MENILDRQFDVEVLDKELVVIIQTREEGLFS